MSEVLVLELPFVTVFWTELGFDRRKLSTEQLRKIEYKWDDEIGPWLETNCKHVCNPHADGVWFEDRGDAAFFKLVWLNNILD